MIILELAIIPKANDWKGLALGALGFVLHRLSSSQSVKGWQPNETDRFFEYPVQIFTLIQYVSRLQLSL